MLIRTLFVLAAMAIVPACNAQGLLEKYQAGTHYFVVEPAQPTAAGKNIEVIEVFSYACIHCAHFEPVVQRWKKTKPGNVAFSYLPAAWNPQWEVFARAYYAAETLGIVDRTHEALFKAIHDEHKPFASVADLAAWYAGFGVSAAQFQSAMDSFAVQTKVARSKTLVPRYGIDGTPTVVVAGK